MKKWITYFVMLFLFAGGMKVYARENPEVPNDTLGIASRMSTGDEIDQEGKKDVFQPKKVIFEHLGDTYGWEIASNLKLPLPVIVRDDTGKWHLFSSKHIEKGKKHEGFYVAGEGKYENKVVGEDVSGNLYRPMDFSITRNVMSIILTALLTLWMAFALVRFYKRKRWKAPRKILGFIEMIIEMLYREVIVGILGEEAKRYASYLLTVFFFIFIANIVGMIAVFPGGANVTGNLSITLVLALCTFVIVNVSGTRRYWKDVFWPDVPTWLKFPLPIMPLIEIFGVFTKPAALMIRLFANMLGGHLIIIILISLIFLFGAMGSLVVGTTTVLSVFFAVFMDLIHVLIAFIQAYVFMMLSALFIGLARVKKSSDE